jgi:hypothetical protein
MGLADPTVTTSPLPFDSAEEAPQPEPDAIEPIEPIEDETTVH